jgi:CTP:molybdopterin cytidylyltransferase MocA
MGRAKVAGVVLAAGAGTRMGGPKAELVVGGTRLVDRAVAVLRAAGCDPVLAVVREGAEVANATVLINPRPQDGLRSSLAIAIEAASNSDAIAVYLVDQPGIGAPAVSAVTAAWRPGRIAVGDYAGTRAHPVVMSPQLWRVALKRAGPDDGARRLLLGRPDLVDVVPVPGDPHDLDTPSDLPA